MPNGDQGGGPSTSGPLADGSARPGAIFVRPIPLLAVLVLSANDHILKGRWPALLTGKVSDFAGLFFFPLLLVALSELLLAAAHRHWQVGKARLTGAVVAAGVVFVAVKVSPALGELYGDALGFLRWPVAAAKAAASSDPWPEIESVRIRTDMTDLSALSMLVLSWVYGRNWIARRRSA